MTSTSNITTKKSDSGGVWDTKLQQYHGGQDWKFLENFVEDFSVTTNALGMPKNALEAAREAIYTCHHYPPADQEPAKTSLAEFLWPNDHANHHKKLLLGNGASELIDLVIRSAAPHGTWKPGPWDVQYKEYQRAAVTNGQKILSGQEERSASLLCIVNPCNPTGDYFVLEELKQWIEANVEDGGVVIVDESMQPWLSRDFRSDSLTSQHEYLASLYLTRKVSLYVIHSWTKFWSCTGLRLGSVVCPTTNHCDALKRLQVPWSVNSPALAFLHAVVKDDAYMEKTWQVTPVWRNALIERLNTLLGIFINGQKSNTSRVENNDDKSLEWKFYGKPFLSWVWVDLKSQKTAQEAVALAKAAGVPVRSGQPGYERPTFVRIAVREPEKVDPCITERFFPHSTGLDMFKRACEATNARCEDDKFGDFIDTINEKLNFVELEFRKSHDEDTGEEVLALVNTSDDEIAKLATDYTPLEISYFRALIEMIINADDETYSVSATTAIKESSKLKPSMTRIAAERALKRFVDDKWLMKTSAGRYSLTQRTILELQNYLKDQYDESIHECTLCYDIVTKGQRCSVEKCSTRLHHHCARRMFQTKPQSERKCPTCSAIWRETMVIAWRRPFELKTSSLHEDRDQMQKGQSDDVDVHIDIDDLDYSKCKTPLSQTKPSDIKVFKAAAENLESLRKKLRKMLIRAPMTMLWTFEVTVSGFAKFLKYEYEKLLAAKPKREAAIPEHLHRIVNEYFMESVSKEGDTKEVTEIKTYLNRAEYGHRFFSRALQDFAGLRKCWNGGVCISSKYRKNYGLIVKSVVEGKFADLLTSTWDTGEEVFVGEQAEPINDINNLF
ncbi:12089_t:CDS:10 [Ambispora gerdemannii]|uniref:Non-structural maintenance of chromosomes element 1 homolog n=1 Tax=Ambispora gerdemannii TaxID=144530 RepID=A0A9N8ZC02_9GLOM|nr:12089_t:CDS:10 [Ambispora gerdemannii]